ncbi:MULTISPECIES: tyrosine-type recombinase/integrase [Enterobacteriaceae]|uniref:tyrosine-type recombinase/integrase n=1 Tax=Enterobacteriaceae TaxID=543 RepID=UPI001FA6BB60|nr:MULTISPECIES: site-specific integrase [Enterobacteriaceae]MCI4450925.1 tyrosine-type recombinase/integrase [Klebsiella variicola]
MAKLILSADTYSQCAFSVDANSGLAILPAGRCLGALPTLYDKDGHFVKVVNNWFFDLKSVESLKNLNSYSRALLSYWSFLEDNQLSWDKFPPVKRLKPTYLFKEHLLTKINKSNIARSTANHYMNHVVHFYKWAINEGFLIIKNEKEAPFILQFVDIARNDKFAYMQRTFVVETVDLKIKVYKDADSQNISSMNPLSRDYIRLLAFSLLTEAEEFRLQCLLAVQCGLRISEACSITVDALNFASPTTELKTRYQILIGPSNGVKTKYGKERHIEISNHLLNELRKYLISERRLKRINKLTKRISQIISGEITVSASTRNELEQCEKFQPLFVSEQGNPADSKVTSVRWSEFRRKIRKNEPEFKHKFHDLRCTYATYRLSDLLEAGLPIQEALDCLRGWMGHKNDMTTCKYLRFLKRQDVVKQKFALLDSIMCEAMEETSEW